VDNASKALLLSGAILLAIAIIGVGMTIFNKAQLIAGESTAPMDSLAVSAHNSRFRLYLEDHGVNGSLITALVGETSAYNAAATNPLLKVTLEVIDDDGVRHTILEPDAPANLYQGEDGFDEIVIANRTYYAQAFYTNDGVITQIDFTIKPNM